MEKLDMENMDLSKVTRTELEEKYNNLVKLTAEIIYAEGDFLKKEALMREAIRERFCLMFYDILQDRLHLKEPKDLLRSPEKDNAHIEIMTREGLQKVYDSTVKDEAIVLWSKGLDEYINEFDFFNPKLSELISFMTGYDVIVYILSLEEERLGKEFLFSSDGRKFIDEKCGSLKKFGQRNNDTCQRTDASMNLEGSKPGYAKGRKPQQGNKSYS